MFFITGLPRSRTSWFAVYFGIAHEYSCIVPRETFIRETPHLKGNSDSGLVFTQFQERWDYPTVIIHRDFAQVWESLGRIGIQIDSHILQKWAECLRELKGFHVDFDSINESLPDICKYVGEEYDSEHTERMINMRVEPLSIDPQPHFEEWLWA